MCFAPTPSPWTDEQVRFLKRKNKYKIKNNLILNLYLCSENMVNQFSSEFKFKYDVQQKRVIYIYIYTSPAGRIRLSKQAMDINLNTTYRKKKYNRFDLVSSKLSKYDHTVRCMIRILPTEKTNDQIRPDWVRVKIWSPHAMQNCHNVTLLQIWSHHEYTK